MGFFQGCLNIVDPIDFLIKILYNIYINIQKGMIIMGKVYACADLHGQYELWKQIRDYCAEDDIIYFLGDACDRGPEGIKIIKELRKEGYIKDDVAVILSDLEISENTFAISKKINKKETIKGFLE